MIDLIYCAGGNPTLSQIAFEEGWKLGFRSDKHLGNFLATFIDVEYKRPDFKRHLQMVARHRPRYATVPDLSEQGVELADIHRAITQAEQLARYCEIPLIVPKLSGQLDLIPAEFAVGYSVPSQYGGAQYPLWELADRRIHLLGGSPRKQFEAYLHLSAIATVLSADGNYAQLMATRYGQYWERHVWPKHPGVAAKEKNIYLDCWKRSCINLLSAWQKLTA